MTSKQTREQSKGRSHPKHLTDAVFHSGHGRYGKVSVYPLCNRRASSFVPLFPMGQYFKAVNMDKREVVCPWCLSGGAKLWEWAANPSGAVFCLLLRKSSGSGGGDYYGYRTQEIHVDSDDPKQAAQTVIDAMQSGVAMEGQPISPAKDSVVGRWAGDRVVLVGDYDESKLWDELPRYRNISRDLVAEWNAFIEIPTMQLTFNDDCSCNKEKPADTEAAAA